MRALVVYCSLWFSFLTSVEGMDEFGTSVIRVGANRSLLEVDNCGTEVVRVICWGAVCSVCMDSISVPIYFCSLHRYCTYSIQ